MIKKEIVIFRKDKNNGEIVAVFPYLISGYKANINRFRMTCYAHVGQHSDCVLDWYYGDTIPAKEKEYNNLKAELERIGYELIIKKNISYKLLEKEFENREV